VTTVEKAGNRKTAARRDLTDAQANLLAVLDRIGPDDWSRPSPNEGWTVRDLLCHVATAEVGFVPSLKKMAAGGGGVPDDFDPNRWNAGQLRRRAEASVGELRADLESAHKAMLALLNELDDAALDQTGRLSSGGVGSLEDAFRLVARHKRSHTADIAAALD
jgi:uncharacterized protein (TIGR03083 family)